MRSLFMALAVVAAAATSAAAQPSIVIAPVGATDGVTTAGVHFAGEVTTFHNADLSAHYVVAEDEGSGSQAWCALLDVHFRAQLDARGIDGCPLFFAQLTQPGASRTIAGTELLTPGRVYGFWCLIHPDLDGVIYTF